MWCAIGMPFLFLAVFGIGRKNGAVFTMHQIRIVDTVKDVNVFDLGEIPAEIQFAQQSRTRGIQRIVTIKPVSYISNDALYAIQQEGVARPANHKGIV